MGSNGADKSCCWLSWYKIKSFEQYLRSKKSIRIVKLFILKLFILIYFGRRARRPCLLQLKSCSIGRDSTVTTVFIRRRFEIPAAANDLGAIDGCCNCTRINCWWSTLGLCIVFHDVLVFGSPTAWQFELDYRLVKPLPPTNLTKRLQWRVLCLDVIVSFGLCDSITIILFQMFAP